MAGNGEAIRRLHNRKVKESQTRQNNYKRKSSKELFVQRDEENVLVGAGGGDFGRRSYPPENGGDQGLISRKKVARTDTSDKQRRALCDRSSNNSSHDSVPFKERRQQHTAEGRTSSVDTPRRSKGYMDLSSSRHEADEMEIAGCSPPYVMDIDGSALLMSPCRPAPPSPVHDIDCCPDSVTTTTYSQDIMKYLMWIEARDLLKPGFLDDMSAVSAKMRGVLVDWLLQVQNHEGLKDETLHLCVSLIDSYLGAVEVKMHSLQLVGITCMLIACKFNERFAPEVSTLCHLTENTFKRSEVLSYERIILATLHFKLGRAVAVTFLDRYLQVHRSTPLVECMARYLLDLSLTSVSFVSALPSLKASSALYLSRMLLLDCSATWTPDLIYYTSYTATQLQSWATEFIQLLVKAPASKFQGARGKYNCEEYFYISYNERAKPELLVRKKCG